MKQVATCFDMPLHVMYAVQKLGRGRSANKYGFR